MQRNVRLLSLVALPPYQFSFVLITPHAQRERGKVIGCGVHYPFH